MVINPITIVPGPEAVVVIDDTVLASRPQLARRAQVDAAEDIAVASGAATTAGDGRRFPYDDRSIVTSQPSTVGDLG